MILAIIIAAVVIFLFIPRFRNIIIPASPEASMESCISGKIKESIGIISLQGGSFKPVNYYLYKDNKIEYLCYTNEYYKTCTMQQPLIKQHIERELETQINEQAKKCLENVKSSLEKKGYKVNSNSNEFKVNINEQGISIEFPGIVLAKGDKTEKINNFKTTYKSKIYNLLMITTSILNWEARYGDSDTTTYMLYYPTLKVEKLKQEDGSKIYILTETSSKDKFVFATRSLSWPAGYGLGKTYTPIKK